MPITVTTPEEPVESQTPLFSLKQRRAEIADKLYIDLRVPRWNNPALYVRYRPIDTGEMQEKVQRRENVKPRPKDWMTLANADVLIACCEGLYACLDGEMDNKFSLRLNDPHGTWTKFDGDLALALGLPQDARATAIVRCLYLTDGDLIDAASKLLDFSGESNEEINKDF